MFDLPIVEARCGARENSLKKGAWQGKDAVK